MNIGETLEAFPVPAFPVPAYPTDEDKKRALAQMNSNGPELFQALAKATGGRVRHSVRWKMPRRRVADAYIRYVKGFTLFSPMSWPAVMKSYRLALARNRRKLAARKSRDTRTYKFTRAWLTVDCTSQRRVTQDPQSYFQLIRKYHSSIGSAEKTRTISTDARDDWHLLPDEGDWEEFTDDDALEFTHICESDWDDRKTRKKNDYVVDEYHFSPKYVNGVGDWINISLMEVEAVRELLSVLKRPAALILFLKALQSAIYRAYAVRRVRSPVRRTRIPRPPDLLPLPPAAPLAPPA